MSKKSEKKVEILEEKIKEFIDKMKESRKEVIEKGNKAIKVGNESQIKYWVVQYKLTENYEKNANEMLGQLDIARYSNKMQSVATEFFSCMGSMAKELSKVFGYTSPKQVRDSFDRKMIKYQTALDNGNELIEQTTESFNDMQEELKTNNEESIQISDDEKNRITNIFNSSKATNNNDISSTLSALKNLF